MPQMSTLLWLYLFIYFMSIYLIIMIMIYNLYIFMNIKMSYKSLNYFKKFLFLW